MSHPDRLCEAALQSAAREATVMGRDMRLGIVGYGLIEHRRGGDLIGLQPFHNIITTVGDEYYARKGIVGVSPAGATTPTNVTGMKLGTGYTGTAAAKSGTHAALITYLTGSNQAFDATYPQVAAVGGDGGWNAIYKSTWAANDATNSAINEAVIVTTAIATDATSNAAATVARVVFTDVNKQAADTLAITWNHKFLGS